MRTFLYLEERLAIQFYRFKQVKDHGSDILTQLAVIENFIGANGNVGIAWQQTLFFFDQVIDR